ncbi:hypothetical protein [Allomuricauda sp. d1]|uniref:hypothetical protein n=1 Tax=Allomuricauda sp. d1 TaxID=3136725 RepID=UPI0031E0AC5B
MKKLNFLPAALFAIVLMVPFFGSAKKTESCCEEDLSVKSTVLNIENEKVLKEEIVFVEDEEEIDLGFDTAYYLPYDFDAYSGMQLEVYEIEYVEECETKDDFRVDFQKYLPKNFNPYVGQ